MIKEDLQNKRKYFLLKGQLFKDIAILNQNNEDANSTLVDLIKKEKEKDEAATELVDLKIKYLTEELYYRAFKCLEQAAGSISELVNDQNISSTSKAFFMLGEFCDNILKAYEDSKLKSGSNSVILFSLGFYQHKSHISIPFVVV